MPSGTCGRTAWCAPSAAALTSFSTLRPPPSRGLELAGEVEGVHLEVDRVPGPARSAGRRARACRRRACSMWRPSRPTSAAAQVGDGAPRWRAPACRPAPGGRRDLRDDRAGVVEHERSGLGAADVDAEPHGPTSPRQQGDQGARHGGRAAEGRDVGAAARPAALDEHDVVARARAAARRRSRCRVAGADGRGRTTATRAPARHVGLGRPSHRAAAGPHGDAADGEVGGAVSTCTIASGPGAASQARAASPTRKAPSDGRVGQRSRRDVGADAGPRHPLAVADARARTRDGGLGHPVARAADPASHGRHDGGVHRVVGLLVGVRSRGRAGRTPAASARTAASGMPVSRARTGHVEGVGDDRRRRSRARRAARPSTVRENVAGLSGSSAGTTMCDVMIAGDAGRDGGAERHQLARRAAPRRSRRRAAAPGASRWRCRRGRGSAWRRPRPRSTAGPRPRPRRAARRGRGRRRSCAPR